MSNDLIIGAGEIGRALKEILSVGDNYVAAMDLEPVDNVYRPFDFMHICIPYRKDFDGTVLCYIAHFQPRVAVIIHSTVMPGTTAELQKQTETPIVYSPIRGVHKSMVQDIRYYTKFYAGVNKKKMRAVRARFVGAGLKAQPIRDPTTLEWAKILCDTTYYHVMLAYTQWTYLLCKFENIDHTVMWRFAEEIHTKLGNRPKMYVDMNGIGGHCVIQNTALIQEMLEDNFLKWMLELNEVFKGGKVQ